VGLIDIPDALENRKQLPLREFEPWDHPARCIIRRPCARFFSRNLNLKMLVTYWQSCWSHLCSFVYHSLQFLDVIYFIPTCGYVSMEWMIYWKSVRS